MQCTEWEGETSRDKFDPASTPSVLSLSEEPFLQSMSESSNDGSTGPKKRWTKVSAETKSFGDHIVADHTVVKANVRKVSKVRQ